MRTVGRPPEVVRAEILAELRRRFPEVPCWWGPYTCRWWAMVSWHGRPRLVEALNLEELLPLIIATRTRPPV
ncbi:hypothetical protein [Actinomadura alba]|uniref:Uncharacterized protein n=1 Tax=Actinomadura alba TaxID=406431 RepID=A0ABR7LHP0_9ACTN|nr:hypothetical protein [Actinomadura alba]MBC6464020.1 hypothetical protein [Actinomadura alba]